MGNMGAFITIYGNNLEPHFKTFQSVVSTTAFSCNLNSNASFNYLQPHPDVKPMAYANSLMSLLA